MNRNMLQPVRGSGEGGAGQREFYFRKRRLEGSPASSESRCRNDCEYACAFAKRVDYLFGLSIIDRFTEYSL